MSSRDERVAGQLIEEIRRAGGLSQAELARRAGFDRSVLNAYEHGRRQPSVSALARIAAAAGLDLRVTTALDGGAVEHAGRVLSQVLDLAGALPYRPRRDLTYPPLGRLAA